MDTTQKLAQQNEKTGKRSILVSYSYNGTDGLLHIGSIEHYSYRHRFFLTDREIEYSKRHDLISDYSFCLDMGCNAFSLTKLYSTFSDSALFTILEYDNAHRIRFDGVYHLKEDITPIKTISVPHLEWDNYPNRIYQAIGKEILELLLSFEKQEC